MAGGTRCAMQCDVASSHGRTDGQLQEPDEIRTRSAFIFIVCHVLVGEHSAPREADIASTNLMQIIIPRGLGLQGFTNVAAQRELANYLN
jgi:hypothetical protein